MQSDTMLLREVRNFLIHVTVVGKTNEIRANDLIAQIDRALNETAPSPRVPLRPHWWDSPKSHESLATLLREEARLRYGQSWQSLTTSQRDACTRAVMVAQSRERDATAADSRLRERKPAAALR